SQKHGIECVFILTRTHIGVGPRSQGDGFVTIVLAEIDRIRCEVVIAEVLFRSYPVTESLQGGRNPEYRIVTDKGCAALLDREGIEIAKAKLGCLFVGYVI